MCYGRNAFARGAEATPPPTIQVFGCQNDEGVCFSNGQAFTFLNIVEPGATYGDRLNDVDLRFGKILKYGRTRSLVVVDVFKWSTPDVYSTSHYGPTYLNPLNITAARFAKISVQFDF